MNLQEFVSETLSQIVHGVAEAKNKNLTSVAPELAGGEDAPRHLQTMGSQPVFLVQFDVAVTAAESSEHGGGGGLTVLSLASVKGELKKSIESSSISRVKFEVPVIY